MSSKKVFITGISGSVGHYVFDELVKDPELRLYLLVRDPGRLKFDPALFFNVTVVQGDLSHIEEHAALLKEMDYAIHIATGWGGGRKIYEIDHDKTLELFRLLDPDRCRKAIYFSTASLLNSSNEPMPEAETHGIEYIQAKYRTLMDLPQLKIYPKVITLFPTVIFGGDNRHPYTQPSLGIHEIKKWLWLARFIKLDGSFHFIHARDIARIVDHLVHQEVEGNRFVLGNSPLTVAEAIKALCRFYDKKIYFQLEIKPFLIKAAAGLFGKKLLPWDRFSLEYRHFRYKTANAPAFGIASDLVTLEQILKNYHQSVMNRPSIPIDAN